MSSNISRGFLGSVIMQKISGSGAMGSGTSNQVIIPVFSFEPRDPYNYSYPPLVNKLAYQNTTVLGKRTPSANLATAAKASWFTSTILNSLIVTPDANGDTDVFAFSDDSNTGTTRIYDACRCAALSLSGRNGGGPINVEGGFLVKSAQGTTTFATTVTDGGALISGCAVDFGSTATATLVRAWRLNLIRGLNYDMWVDNTQYADDTSSGMLGGTLQLEQSPKATVQPSATVTLRFATTIASTTKIVNIACALNLDEDYQPHVNAVGNLVKTYTLLTTTTNAPITIT